MKPSRESTTTVEVYDLDSDQWSALPELNVGRSQVSSMYHGGFLYAFGGNNGGYLNSFERLYGACLSGQTANWELIQPDES